MCCHVTTQHWKLLPSPKSSFSPNAPFEPQQSWRGLPPTYGVACERFLLGFVSIFDLSPSPIAHVVRQQSVRVLLRSSGDGLAAVQWFWLTLCLLC